MACVGVVNIPPAVVGETSDVDFPIEVWPDVAMRAEVSRVSPSLITGVVARLGLVPIVLAAVSELTLCEEVCRLCVVESDPSAVRDGVVDIQPEVDSSAIGLTRFGCN